MPRFRYQGPPISVRLGEPEGSYETRQLRPGDAVEPISEPMRPPGQDDAYQVVVGPAPTHALFLVDPAEIEVLPRQLSVSWLVRELHDVTGDHKHVCVDLDGETWMVTDVDEIDDKVWLQVERMQR